MNESDEAELIEEPKEWRECMCQKSVACHKKIFTIKGRRICAACAYMLRQNGMANSQDESKLGGIE